MTNTVTGLIQTTRSGNARYFYDALKSIYKVIFKVHNYTVSRTGMIALLLSLPHKYQRIKKTFKLKMTYLESHLAFTMILLATLFTSKKFLKRPQQLCLVA